VTGQRDRARARGGEQPFPFIKFPCFACASSGDNFQLLHSHLCLKELDQKHEEIEIVLVL
jgi:hypothetical protein